MRFGAHAVLFTTAIATNTDHVLSQLAQAGARGVELGARFFGVEKNLELKEAMQRHGLELSGLHASVALAQLLDDKEQAEQTLTQCARFLEVMPNKNIIMTGGVSPENWNEPDYGDPRLTQVGSARQIAQTLNALAKKLDQEYGVRLCYHNHNWEFANDALIYKALMEEAGQLCFALDTGWAAIMGYDPATLIESAPERFVYAHLRDYDKSIDRKGMDFESLQQGYMELGTGDMDFERLLTALHHSLGKDGFAIVEYERGPVDAGRYAKALRFIAEKYASLHLDVQT